MGRFARPLTLHMNCTRELHGLAPYAIVDLGTSQETTNLSCRSTSSVSLTWHGQERISITVMARKVQGATEPRFVGEGFIVLPPLEGISDWNGHVEVFDPGDATATGTLCAAIDWGESLESDHDGSCGSAHADEESQETMDRLSEVAMASDAVESDIASDVTLLHEVEVASRSTVIGTTFLEELRTRFLDGQHPGDDVLRGDNRALLVHEKIMDGLQELPSEESLSGLPALVTWQEYVAQSLGSIRKREHLVDEHGQPRVTREWCHPNVLASVTLADWHGRRRAQVAFNADGEPQRVCLVSSNGKEMSYTTDTFDAACRGVSLAGCSLRARYELARRYRVAQLRDPSSDAQTSVQVAVETLFSSVCAKLRELLRIEHDGGRLMVPPVAELLEMTLEQVLEQLEKPAQA
uniref:Uncharacterized protein n=1 Tax=Noctiluca scintillans TaxID=2966 RepID=A0A7S1EYH7_NOCSC|mmetsp:Transcript_17651/g.47705  ORF Transcript_17651/g.47705 Transcript_17651/m.47705 type:complete len:408 (+) Transcript_17651:61-1284(+)|eukprot:CAMPEP_0194506638 /NCGR_PEP_ID=MMETSP0253-20130528/35093_1 /TAXON_ID=2966 /ORGANISM="Noctiluca scintillans" /LENGTH=407 /DNA_ID=CAMNT_0039349399 /DNA_START=36 /DNA_END=1259 /DNA_ORIENTATION=+